MNKRSSDIIDVTTHENIPEGIDELLRIVARWTVEEYHLNRKPMSEDEIDEEKENTFHGRT